MIMKKFLKRFNPNDLVNMYDYYTKNHKESEKSSTVRKKECIFKMKYTSLPERGADITKVTIPIHGEISLMFIPDREAELSFTNENGAKVVINCSRQSWKPKEFLKKGFQDYLWQTKITTELGIVSCYEIGHENTQFKRIPSNKVERKWDDGCEFIDMIVADFRQNYLPPNKIIYCRKLLFRS